MSLEMSWDVLSIKWFLQRSLLCDQLLGWIHWIPLRGFLCGCEGQRWLSYLGRWESSGLLSASSCSRCAETLGRSWKGRVVGMDWHPISFNKIESAHHQPQFFSIPECRMCGSQTLKVVEDLSSRSGPLAYVNQCASRNCFECFGTQTRLKTCGSDPARYFNTFDECSYI